MGRPSRSCATAGLALLVLGTACHDSAVESLPSPPPASPTVATATRVDLGTLGGAHSYATDINDQETVVGWSENAAGISRAFRWTQAGGMTDLGTLPGDEWSRAISITATGEVIGLSGVAGDNNGSPVVWSASGEATPLPIPLPPGAMSMLVADGNASGQVVGSALGGSFMSHAWTWTRDDGIYDIGSNVPGGSFESYGSGTNNSGRVVGTNHASVCSRTAECWHAFVWSADSGYRDIGIPGSDLASAQVTGNALNDRGVVVGWTNPSAGSGTQPFRWTDSSGFTLLPTFSPDPNTYGYGQSVNLAGTTVGASMDAETDAIQAAAWPAEGGIVKLSAGDLNPSVAVAVNDDGVVVGWSSLDCCGAANHATLWTLQPGRGATPSSIAGQAPSPLLAAARGARSGPVACLSDRRAVLSRQLLINCVAQRGE